MRHAGGLHARGEPARGRRGRSHRNRRPAERSGGARRNAIRWLRQHPAEACRMGAAGRARVLERFTWDRVVQQCLAIYDGTAARPRARSCMSASRLARSHLITCEYPPDVGGVADHTRSVASGLAAAGVGVHVWCPPGGAADRGERGVVVHVLPGSLRAAVTPRAAPRAGRGALTARRIFVQWVPHGYGRRSLNVAFCAWVLRRARVHGDRVEVMVHEAYLAFDRRRVRQSGAALAAPRHAGDACSPRRAASGWRRRRSNRTCVHTDWAGRSGIAGCHCRARLPARRTTSW